MKNVKQPLVIITILFLMAIALSVLPTLGKRAWVRASGAVMANSSGTLNYTDKPFRILSVKGERWATWDKLENAFAYHALVVLPMVVPEDSGSMSGGDDFTHINTRKWKPLKGQTENALTEERELSVRYDALWQTITVASQKYRLANGNLFVVRFNENWQPEITQLKATIDKDVGFDEVRRAFKSALSEDEAIQQL